MDALNPRPAEFQFRQPLATAVYQVFDGVRTGGKETFDIDSLPTGYHLRAELIRLEPQPLEHGVQIETDAGGRIIYISLRSRASGEEASAVIRPHTGSWFATRFTNQGRTDFFMPFHPYFLSPICAFLTVLERRIPISLGIPETFPVISIDPITLIPSQGEATLTFVDENPMNGVPARHYTIRGPIGFEHFWTDLDGVVLARGRNREEITHQLQTLVR